VPLLELDGVEARYGPVRALRGVSMTVDEGEVVAVLGANGAGKTTTLRAISGTVRRTGAIRLAGQDIGRRRPESVARAGIAHAPEGRGTFVELTVRENLTLGAYTRSRADTRAALQRVVERFPWMERRGDQQAGTLSGGEQQMLALARALMQQPQVLLLDEPSLGLAPIVVRELYEIVRRLNEEDGLTALVVEQNAALALDTASRAYVLEAGEVALEGTSAELRKNEAVRRSYLGY
jgi:branched-chain amino acid transport system ATP-binding protein